MAENFVISMGIFIFKLSMHTQAWCVHRMNDSNENLVPMKISLYNYDIRTYNTGT